MLVDFKILKKNETGEFDPMNNNEACSVSIGGFSFDIGTKSVPFDWDAFTGVENNGIFSFVTGKGFAFNDFELADYYDKDYKDMGLKKEDISAVFLSSVHHIEEFSVDFLDGEEEVVIGFFDDNAKSDAEYKLELVGMSFEDMETEKVYEVKKEVLEAFNRGERSVLSLDEQIKCSEALKVKDDNAVSAPANEREER